MILEAIVLLQVVNLSGFTLMFWFARRDARTRLDLMEILRQQLLHHAARHDAMLKAFNAAAYVTAINKVGR